MVRKRSAISLACLALVLSGASRAEANGRFPQTNQLVAAPADPDLYLIRTTFGLLVSHDHGQNWDWICEQAYGFAANTDPSIAITQSSAFLLGKFDGLEVSPNSGCAWAGEAQLASQFVSDVVVRPDDPHTALVVTSTGFASDAGADAGTSYVSQVWKTTDDGAHWAPAGAALDPSWITETIEVAASDPHRIYVSAARGLAGSREGAFFSSTDDGAHWTMSPIALDKQNETSPFIGAVDPKNPDRVYVRTGGAPLVTATDGAMVPPPSRLLVSDDAGLTWKVATTLSGQMAGFALSVDGARVFIGSVTDGLLSASTTDLAFSKVSSIHVQCLRATATELWACSDEPSGFIVGVSGDLGKTFEPKLHLTGLRGPIQCADRNDAATAICSQYFPPLCDTLGGCASPSNDAGPKPPPPTPTPGSSAGCGCEVGPKGAAGLGAGAALATVMLAVARRRSSRRRER